MGAPVFLSLMDLVSRDGGADQSGERWVQVATVEGLARDGVIYDQERLMFLVDGAQGPVALFALSPHNPTGRERVLFCPSSGWFEEPAHGEKFDHRGVYAAGPAPRGLDRFDARVSGRAIEVNVAVVYEGAPRGATPLPARGESCEGPEGPPGFFGDPPDDLVASG